MARRKFDAPVTDDTCTVTPDEVGDITTGDHDTRANRRRREVPTGRITLTLDKEVLAKLRVAAIYEGTEPCRIVENLLRPAVRHIVVSHRYRRSMSEDSSAA